MGKEKSGGATRKEARPRVSYFPLSRDAAQYLSPAPFAGGGKATPGRGASNRFPYAARGRPSGKRGGATDYSRGQNKRRARRAPPEPTGAHPKDASNPRRALSRRPWLKKRQPLLERGKKEVNETTRPPFQKRKQVSAAPFPCFILGKRSLFGPGEVHFSLTVDPLQKQRHVDQTELAHHRWRKP